MTAGATRRTRRGALAVLALLCWLGSPTGAAGAPPTMHGSGDVFTAPGITVAWAVLRGSDEAATAAVIRIVTDPARYPRVAVTAIDPFTQARQPVLSATRSTGTLDVRRPRTQFADFPRTEIALHAGTDAGAPALVVYYVGLPDTAPEFTDASRLDAYLAARVAHARAPSAGAPR